METSWLKRTIPILSWLPAYDRSWLTADAIAGLSVWGLMVSTSLGYATISGVPVQYGLYVAAISLIFFAIFTTSRQVTTGPSSSTAAVLDLQHCKLAWPSVFKGYGFDKVCIQIQSVPMCPKSVPILVKSEAVFSMGMRRTRYRGVSKTPGYGRRH